MRETMRKHQPTAATLSSSRGAAPSSFTTCQQQQQWRRRRRHQHLPSLPSPISPLPPSFPGTMTSRQPTAPGQPYLAYNGLAYMPIPAPSRRTAAPASSPLDSNSPTDDYVLQSAVFDPRTKSSERNKARKQAQDQDQDQDQEQAEADRAVAVGGNKKPLEALSHVRTITAVVPLERGHPDLFHAYPAAAADAGRGKREVRSQSSLRFRETYAAGPPGEGHVFWGLVKGEWERRKQKKREKERQEREGKMDEKGKDRGRGDAIRTSTWREPKDILAWSDATLSQPQPEPELKTHERGDIALQVFENYRRRKEAERLSGEGRAAQSLPRAEKAESESEVPLKISRSMQANALIITRGSVPINELLSQERVSQTRRQAPVRPQRSPIEPVSPNVAQRAPARPPTPFRGRPQQEEQVPVGFLERLHIGKPVSDDGPFSGRAVDKEKEKGAPWHLDLMEQQRNEMKSKISDPQPPMTTRPLATNDTVRGGRAGGYAVALASSVQAPAPVMEQPPQPKKNPNIFNLANKHGYDPDRGTVFSDFMHPSEIGVDTPPMSPGPSKFPHQGVPDELEPLREIEGIGIPCIAQTDNQVSPVPPGREGRQQQPPRKEWWEFDSDEDEAPLSPLSPNRNVSGKNGNSSAQSGYEAGRYVTGARDTGFYGPYHNILDDYGKSSNAR